MPAISIISCLFNADRHIDGFLENFRRQTIYENTEHLFLNVYPSHKHPDEINRKVLNHINDYPQSKYVILMEDPGLYEVWNIGIKIASATLLTNANIDDRNAPDYLEKNVSYMNWKKNVDLTASIVRVTKNENETWDQNNYREEWYGKKKIDLNKNLDLTNQLGSLNIITNKHGEFEEFCENREEKINIIKKTALRDRYSIYVRYTDFSFVDMFVDWHNNGEIISYNIPHCSPVWRKSLHDRFGFFDETNYGTYADKEFWLRCSSGGAVFNLIQEPLVLYLENPNSHNRRLGSKKLLNKLIEKYYKSSIS